MKQELWLHGKWRLNWHAATVSDGRFWLYGKVESEHESVKFVSQERVLAFATKRECEHEVPVAYMLPYVGKSFGRCGKVGV